MSSQYLVNTSRIDYIDAMKGIAILLMIYNHVPLDGLELNRFIGVFHMPLFFLISGYLYKHRSISDLLVRNFRRILIPYAATCVIIFTLNIALNDNYLWFYSIFWGNSKPLSVANIQNLSVGPLWFLTAFFAAMIYCNLLYRLKNKKLMWALLLITFSLSVYQVQKNGFLLPFGMTTGLGGAVFIMVGMEYKKHCTKINKWYLLIAATIWLLCVMIGNCAMSWHIYRLNILQIVGGIFGTYICYLLVRQIDNHSLLWRLLCYVGLYSLPLLCIHSIDRVLGLTENAAGFLVEKIGGNAVLQWQVEVFLKFIFVLVLFMAFKRIRLFRYLYQIK